MKRKFYVTGYVGEGAKRMLLDLKNMESVELIDQVIQNRAIRFLYYFWDRRTEGFRKFHFLKHLFYPWFSVLRICYRKNVENNILFFNSGFCRELDLAVVDKLKKKDRNIRLVLYIVDPMVGFDTPEHREVIGNMDLVYSVNKGDCEKYGFCYYPLIYSREEGDKQKAEEALISVVYYLGSGADRTDVLKKIYQICKAKNVKTDFHVLGNEKNQVEEGIIYHSVAVPYSDNVRFLLRSNCILEIMHKEFDNPTQRYSEAVVYNKKLLTNNDKISTFDFYKPEYMKIFRTVADIDVPFLKGEEKVDYGYEEEFSPRLLIQDIIMKWNTNERKPQEARKDRGL